MKNLRGNPKCFLCDCVMLSVVALESCEKGSGGKRNCDKQKKKCELFASSHFCNVWKCSSFNSLRLQLKKFQHLNEINKTFPSFNSLTPPTSVKSEKIWLSVNWKRHLIATFNYDELRSAGASAEVEIGRAPSMEAVTQFMLISCFRLFDKRLCKVIQETWTVTSNCITLKCKQMKNWNNRIKMHINLLSIFIIANALCSREISIKLNE